jgi:hypothetical protein
MYLSIRPHVKPNCLVQILNLCLMYFNFGKKYSINIIFAEYRSIFWLDYHTYFIKNE